MTDTLFLPFGAAPRPSDGGDVERRITTLLASFARPGVQGLADVRVEADVDGADIASLRIDASGVAVDEDGVRGGPVGQTSVDVVRRDPATVRTLQVSAHPASVMGVPTHLDVAASDVRFDWVVGANQQLYVEVQEPSDAAPAVGTARVAAAHRDIVATAHRVLAELLQEKGFTLTALDLDLQNRGPRSVSVRADATVRKSFLRAGVTVTASASVDPAMVLEIRDANVTSSNPVVDGLIAPFRAKVAAEANRRIDLAAALPPGVRVTDVSIAAGDEVVLSVTLG